MPTYIIGDVQGCLDPLKQLLDKIHYHPQADQLLFTGDLVNRGPASLATLRFVKGLPGSIICVLGNHDLNLLAANCGWITPRPSDTIQEILAAEDRLELLDWLRQQPLLHHDPFKNFILTHAGIYPLWDLAKAKSLAKEVEIILQSQQHALFLKHMYGNFPDIWDDNLRNWDRLRFITNAFTRMRFCTPNGQLDLIANGPPEKHPALIPWYEYPNRPLARERIIFGHWAALGGKCTVPNIYPMDTGCVWGNCLTAICLESQQIFSIPCQNP